MTPADLTNAVNERVKRLEDIVADEFGGHTTVLFAHKQWRDVGEFMAHCSMKWATFLLSLRPAVEMGQASPLQTISRSTTGTDSRGSLDAAPVGELHVVRGRQPRHPSPK